MARESRKQEVSTRAALYQRGIVRAEVDYETTHAMSWEKGYEAACRDLRKLISEVPDDMSVVTDFLKPRR